MKFCTEFKKIREKSREKSLNFKGKKPKLKEKTQNSREKNKNSRKKLVVWEALASYVYPSGVKKKSLNYSSLANLNCAYVDRIELS